MQEKLNRLPSWQKRTKATMKKLEKNITKYEIRLKNYAIDTDLCLCSCPQQKMKSYFLCKHLLVGPLEKIGNNWKSFLCYELIIRITTPLLMNDELNYRRFNYGFNIDGNIAESTSLSSDVDSDGELCHGRRIRRRIRHYFLLTKKALMRKSKNGRIYG